jgi:hypothetical protein
MTLPKLTPKAIFGLLAVAALPRLIRVLTPGPSATFCTS